MRQHHFNNSCAACSQDSIGMSKSFIGSTSQPLWVILHRKLSLEVAHQAFIKHGQSILVVLALRRKPSIYMCETKAQLISTFVFATWIVQFLFYLMGIHGLTVIPFILSGHSFYNSLNIQLFTFYHNSKHFRVCDQDNRTLAILRRLFWKLEIIKRLWI